MAFFSTIHFFILCFFVSSSSESNSSKLASNLFKMSAIFANACASFSS
ncbi:hypothetical protein WZ342_2645 [Enterococcus faecalis]|nr:hypothetical protein WZ342_2645 [Enterococcus faecalis]